MAKEQYIFADANELVLILKGKGGRESHIINCADIQRISFGEADQKFLGIPVGKTRRITIIVKKMGTIEFDECRHTQFFPQYLDILRAYCAENRVTFYDFH